MASALKAGAVDYLIRPVDSHELLRRTGVYARIEEFSAKQDGAESAVLQPPKPASSPKGFLDRFLPGLAGLIQSRFSTSELMSQRYEKLERLGIGSFGEVWKVKNITKAAPNVFVAKIPLSKKLNPKIEKEARILRMLVDNDAVPKVQEVIEVNKKKMLIQEFVKGKTLFEVMELEREEKEKQISGLLRSSQIAHLGPWSTSVPSILLKRKSLHFFIRPPIRCTSVPMVGKTWAAMMYILPRKMATAGPLLHIWILP